MNTVRRASGLRRRGASICIVAIAMAGFAVGVGQTAAQSGGPETLGHTTVEQRIVPSGDTGFRTLGLGPGEPYAVREQGIGAAKAGRAERRRSLLYFGQLSDFQLADEESPARVEFLDPIGPPVDAAWRPWEALNPQIDEAMIRQLNAFSAQSPVAAGDGSRRAMDLTINTGDAADNQQLNETEWVRTLMEGGTLNPNSGVDPAGYTHELCPPGLVPGAAEAAAYTGVQDYDDYVEGPPQLLRPGRRPRAISRLPRLSGPDGPRPAAVRGRRARASPPTSCSATTTGWCRATRPRTRRSSRSRPAASSRCCRRRDPQTLGDALSSLEPADLLALLTTTPQSVTLVPPDPERQFVSKAQYKQVFLSGSQADGHGFALRRSGRVGGLRGRRRLLRLLPHPGVPLHRPRHASRRAGSSGLPPTATSTTRSSTGSRASSTTRRAATSSWCCSATTRSRASPQVPDEVAPPCTGADAHGHDANPGCDVDPRSSQPIHLGRGPGHAAAQYPHVVAWVAGHSHVNDVQPYANPEGAAASG